MAKKMASDAVKLLIAKLARERGITPETALAIAQIESSLDPNSNYNKSTQYKGLYQIGTSEWDKYGGGKNVYDPTANTNAFLQMHMDNQAALEKKLGRPVTPGEAYLAHQQGVAGAAALINNPDKNAIDIVEPFHGSRARRVILGNGGTANMTGKDFVDLWSGKVDRWSNQFAKFLPQTQQVAETTGPTILGTQSTPTANVPNTILGTQSTPAAVRPTFPNTIANVNLPQPNTMYGTQSTPAAMPSPIQNAAITAGGAQYGPPPPPPPTQKAQFTAGQNALGSGIGLLAAGMGLNRPPIQMLPPSINRPRYWEGFNIDGLLG